jgi:putative membrane protein
VVTGLVIWGFYWRVAGEGGVDLAKVGPFHTVLHALRAMPTGQRVALVAFGLIAFVAVTSTVGYVLAFWNFRLVRHPGGTLQVTRGLITARATSIERRRLVGATVSEPLPLRAVGAARVVAIATGLRTGRGAERGGEVLLPPAPRAVSAALVQRALDGAGGATIPLDSHGPAARRRRIVRGLLPGAVLSVVLLVVWGAGGPAWPLTVAAALTAIGAALGFDRANALGHGRTGGYLVTRGGSLVRRRSLLEEQAIIGWNLRSTFFQRRLGLVSLEATTAAGRQGYHLTDVPADEALAVVGAISPDLLEPFRAAPPTTSR